MQHLEDHYLPDLQANLVTERFVDPRSSRGACTPPPRVAFGVRPEFLTQSGMGPAHNRSGGRPQPLQGAPARTPAPGLPGVSASSTIAENLIERVELTAHRGGARPGEGRTPLRAVGHDPTPGEPVPGARGEAHVRNRRTGKRRRLGARRERRCRRRRRDWSAAWGAFEHWRAVSPFDRSATLRRWHGLIVSHAETGAQPETMTREMWLAPSEARGEALYAAGFVEWYAEEAKRAARRVGARPRGPQAHRGDAGNRSDRPSRSRRRTPTAMHHTQPRFAGPGGRLARMWINPPGGPLDRPLRLAELWLEAGGPPGDPAGAAPNIKLQLGGRSDDERDRDSTRSPSLARPRWAGHDLLPPVGADDSRSCRWSSAGMRLTWCSTTPTWPRPCARSSPASSATPASVRVHQPHLRAGRHPRRLRGRLRGRRAHSLTVGDPLVAGTTVRPPWSGAQGMAKVEAHVADAIAKGATVVTGGARGRMTFSTSRRC